MTDQEPTQVYQPPTIEPPVAQPSAAEPPPPVPVATAPLESASKGARPGRSKLKWLVAGLVVLLVAGTAAGATLLLTSDSGDPAVLAYTPADSVAYAELRLDLPGSQSGELAKVMKAFPGFEDQAAFPMKLSEALDLLVGQATDGKQGYKNDIEPWFGGQIGASMGPLPAKADPAAARGVVLLGVKDAAKATAWADGLAAKSGTTTTTETYNGVTITIVEPSAGALPDAKGMSAAYAVVGPVLAIGDPTSVKAVIDTDGKTGLNTNAQFQEAEASVTGDRLGFRLRRSRDPGQERDGPRRFGDRRHAVAADLARGRDAAVGRGRRPRRGRRVRHGEPLAAHGIGRAGDQRRVQAAGRGAADHRVPRRGARRRQDDHLGQGPARRRARAQGARRPAGRGAGDRRRRRGHRRLDRRGRRRGHARRHGDRRQASSSSRPMPPPPTSCSSQVKAFIQLGGAQAGLSVTEEQYDGTTITVIDLSGLGGLVGQMSEGAVAAPADLKLAYAVTDEVVVFGIGTDFVKSVLDASAGESLADTERFSTALTQAGKEHASLFWLDVAATRDFVEGMVPAADRSEYDANLKPYLEAFDTVIGTTIPGDEIDSGTVIIRVTGN